RLYLLGETGSETRLFVLEPRTGELAWSQTISSDAPSGYDLFRRGTSLAPSISGETVVCQVGSDQVVAVDLCRRALLWRHRFHDPTEAIVVDLRRRQQIEFRDQRLAQQGAWFDQNHWLDSTPVISGHFVVVTPRDANDLYCLNLEDGTLVWKKPRDEGLFIA